MATVTGYTAAKMEEIVDSTVVAGLVDVNGHLLLEKHDGTTVDAGMVKGEDGAGALYPIDLGPDTGVQRYQRLALLDGFNITTGASIQFLLSGLGDYGSPKRGTALIHVGQRGVGIVNVRGWTWGCDDASNPLTIYTRQLSDFQFEVWAKFAAYDGDTNMLVLSQWRTSLTFDNTVTVEPLDLVPATLTRGDLPADITASKLRLTGTGDVSDVSTGHAFQIGADTALNVAFDDNEIQGRNNGVAAGLGVNVSGGDVNLGHIDYLIQSRGFFIQNSLPDPITLVSTNPTNTITATSFATITGMSTTLVLARACWVQVDIGGWLSAPTGDLRVGIDFSGSTVEEPNFVNGDTDGWGTVMWASNEYNQRSATKIKKLNAGSTVIACQAYSGGSGTRSANYITMFITPLRWAK